MSSKKVFGEHYKHMAEEKCDFSSHICTAVDKMGWGENIIIQLLDEMNVSESVISQKGLSWIGMQTYHFQVHIYFNPKFSTFLYGHIVLSSTEAQDEMKTTLIIIII